MSLIAIIGGTGVYDPKIINNIEEKTIETPYGEVKYIQGNYKDKDVIFMNRHGAKHSIPPHLINYRANIWALKKLGVNGVISTTSVGSLQADVEPGTFVLVDQFLDFTKQRITTFYDGGERGVVHVDVTNPYCPEIRDHIYKIGQEMGLKIQNGGVYVCTEGPRFESAAEVKMYAQLGGDVVGMTNVPEVTLAAEAEICYMTISLVSNYGTGISPNQLTHTEVFEAMAENSLKLKNLILAAIETFPEDKKCHCESILAGYGGFKL